MHSHCGECSQCIDRRLAALAAGYTDDEDPSEMYASDVLHGSRKHETLILAERVVGSARDVDAMEQPEQLLDAHGELNRILPNMNLDYGDALRRVFQLQKRHARQVSASGEVFEFFLAVRRACSRVSRLKTR